MTTTTKRALIIVDVQNDFISGSLAVDGGEQVARRISNLLTTPDQLGRYDLVVTTQDWHIHPGNHWSDSPDFVDSWPVHGKAGTWGAELHDDLKNDDLKNGVFTRRFFKGQYSAAYSGFEGGDSDYGQADAGLGEYLLQAGVTEVDVVGIALDYCVKATAIDAVKYGFDTHVLVPYTAAVSPEGAVAARDQMTAAGVHVEEIAA